MHEPVTRRFENWHYAGAVLGMAAGLLDGLRAVYSGGASTPRSSLALLLDMLFCGGLGALASAAVARIIRHGDQNPPRHWSAIIREGVGIVTFLVAGSLWTTVFALPTSRIANVLVAPERWRTRTLVVLVVVCTANVFGFRLLRRWAMRAPFRTGISLAGVSAALLLTLNWASRDDLIARLERPRETPPEEYSDGSGSAGPNVLLIVLDTTRADHLSLYGYPESTTPFLEELANSGTVYEAAIATAPWTVPSHASIFTGQYPSTHGATSEHRILRASSRTIAEVLGAQGYETVGISSNSWVGPAFQLDQGFQRFYQVWRAEGLLAEDPLRRTVLDGFLAPLRPPSPSTDKGAELVNVIARRWLADWRQRSARRPFFMFVNYIEAHLPYVPPTPYAQRFLKSPPGPNVEGLRSGAWLQEIFRRIARPSTLSSDDHRQLRALYDAELSYQDDRLRFLIRDFERCGLLEDTVVIIVGDHGENLGEHGGLLDHCFSVHQSVLHVPLLVRYPRLFPRGMRYPKLVSTVSIFSTVLDVTRTPANLRAAIDPPPLPTRLEQPGLNEAVSEYDLPVFELSMLSEVVGSDVRPFAVRQRAIQNGAYKVIAKSDGSQLLFDLTVDPSEDRPLDARARPEGERLLQTLAAWVAAHPRPTWPSEEMERFLDEDTLKSLRSLGYIR